MKKIILSLCVVGVIAIAVIVMAQIRSSDILGPNGYVYSIVWDGFKGELVLRAGTRIAESVLTKDSREYKVRYQILLDPQQSVDGMRGPGYIINSSLKHRIVFWVDFNNTPSNLTDDQRFDGYVMTQTKDAIAGITWWSRIPFGFYAIKKYGVPK